MALLGLRLAHLSLLGLVLAHLALLSLVRLMGFSTSNVENRSSQKQCSVMTANFLQRTLARTSLNSNFKSFNSSLSKTKSPIKRLRLLDIITPKPIISTTHKPHLRLVQDFIQTHRLQNFADDLPPISSSNDTISTLFQLQTDGLRAGPSILSNALSSCACTRNFLAGIQVHCLVITTGFIANVYIGTSLISLYTKCGDLDYAYRLFEEMPVRNAISWTAIINGFAQELHVDACFDLYRRMRNLCLKPNHFTLSSFLSACAGSGSLVQGRVIHGQVVQMGFDSFVYIGNALISMYSKCGEMKDAACIFETMCSKDLVSWNSMIDGYSQHGPAIEAIALFEEMNQRRVKPDGITFLGILASCRHKGNVEQGKIYFESMTKYGVTPKMDHYAYIVDLLGRAGLIDEARDFIKKMPISPNAIVWGTLLFSCRLHGNVWVGIEAAENRLELEPWCSSTHQQLASLYASVGWWDQAGRVRKLMKDKGLKTDTGYSWIEIRNLVYQFSAEDGSNCKMDKILELMHGLIDHMRCLKNRSGIQEDVDCDIIAVI